jgi:hypothetical protein
VLLLCVCVCEMINTPFATDKKGENYLGDPSIALIRRDLQDKFPYFCLKYRRNSEKGGADNLFHSGHTHSPTKRIIVNRSLNRAQDHSAFRKCVIDDTTEF